MINSQKQQQSTNEIRREEVASRMSELARDHRRSWEKSGDTEESQQLLEENEEEEERTEDELRIVQLKGMEDNAMVFCAAALSLALYSWWSFFQGP
jgi:hypothetical protein